MVKKIYFIIIVLLATLKISAQTCTVIVNSNLVCLGSAINFSATFTPGLTPSIYEWNFGNGVTNNQASPTYNYPNTGNFTPTLKITFTNNSQCMVNGSNIQVVALPIADFSITTATRQCFKGNNVCVNDLSKPGPSGSPLNIRTFLWGDGGFDVSPISNKNFCNTYTNCLQPFECLIIASTPLFIFITGTS
jgi:PKD repeat protein